MYDEEEEEVVQRIVIPRHKILYSDLEMPKKDTIEVNILDNTNPNMATDKKELPKTIMTEKILEYAAKALEGSEYDKDIATKFKRLLDDDPELNNPSVTNAEKNVEEHGVWQVIIGRQFIASISFDSKYLLYFYFEEQEKYFLVFRS